MKTCLSRMALTSFAAVLLLAAQGLAQAKKPAGSEASFYKRGPLFAFRPKETRRGQTVGRFGPVGIAIELTLPAFGMKVKGVEKGSPADGKLKAGQIIETINGERLAGIDPRIQLGNMITRAEAGDGKMTFVARDRKDAPEKTVVITIPKLGSYSETWPLACAKSEAIVRNLARHLSQREELPLSHGAGPAMTFMLSTGEEEDLAVVRRWIKGIVAKYRTAKDVAPIQNWTVGYAGIPLCEYYLRTGDRTILPVIKLVADHAAWDMYNNGWAHGTYQGRRGRDAHMAFPYMGGGHINACGVHVVTFLLLAKECGVEIDEPTLQASFKHFMRFACRGNVPYGDGIPEQSFVDNGKTGGLAFTMAAAASLTPEGEKSVYAGARDNSAIKGFYSTSWMLIGHTGGGVGEIWRSASMGLMYEKDRKKYREFMDSRRWFYELSRRHDGSFGIVGGGRYDKHDSWGISMGLSYTIPRKKLRLAGAPKTPFSRTYALPEIPWGTAADNRFCTNAPATEKCSPEDLAKETFLNGSSRAAFGVMANTEVKDDVLLKYAHHPDHGIRRGAASLINRHKRYHLIPQLLKSEDPRVRHAGTMVIHCTFKRRPMPAAELKDDVVELLAKMIHDPEEAWWGIENALKALALASPEQIEPHVDRLVHFLGHEEWWLSAAAMAPLGRIAGKEAHARKILPVMGRVISNTTHVRQLTSASSIIDAARSGNANVKALAMEVLQKAYADFPTPEQIHPPEKISMKRAVDTQLQGIGGLLIKLPDGANSLFAISKQRYPNTLLPHNGLYRRIKSSELAPEVKKAVEEQKKLDAAKKK